MGALVILGGFRYGTGAMPAPSASTPRTAEPARALLAALGPSSAPARCLVTRFYQQIEAGREPRIAAALMRWEHALTQLPGSGLGRLCHDRAETPSPFRDYGMFDSPVRPRSFLFAVQTYFVLVARLLAAELIVRSDPGRSTSPPSFLAVLSTASFDRVFRELCRLEDGRLCRDTGVETPDSGYPASVFAWYLDAFDQTVSVWLATLARALDDALHQVLHGASPARDVLKDLYQALVPKRFRAALGEFYTPDWLADLVLDEVGYHGEPDLAVLDPACGSGTFLVQAISRAAWKEGRDPGAPAEVERVAQVLTKIAGLDLNPVAVEAARANLLLHLWPVLPLLPRPLRIPVYCTDAVATPGEVRDLYGHVYRWTSSGGELDLPIAAVNGGWLVELLQLADQFSRGGNGGAFAGDRFLEAAKTRLGADRVAEAGEEAVRRCGLQWSRVSRADPALAPEAAARACIPLRLSKVDRVVGNPPWIRWRAIGAGYRRATMPLWGQYGLFPLKGLSTLLGAGEKDFSMLFTYRCADLYLKTGGRLGFLITMEALRSKGAGQGFRRFRLGEQGDFLRVRRVHDLVSVSPFPGVGNKTALLVLERGARTTFPVPFIQWVPLNTRVGADWTLEKVRSRTRRLYREARPLSGRVDAPWRVVEASKGSARPSSAEYRVEIAEASAGMEGQGAYRAYRGASTEPYGVYRVRLKSPQRRARPARTVVVENLPEHGKRNVPKLPAVELESALVYPAVRGSDIRRWHATAGICVVMPHDPLRREGYSEEWLRGAFPKTYAYLLRFKDLLLSRASQALRTLARKSSFYAMYGIGPYTLSRHKVIWQRQANDLHAAVVGPVRLPGLGSKPAIPTDTTAMLPASSAREAHYLCGVLNAASVRAYLRSFTAAGRGFGAPSILEHLRVPRFDRRNARHVRIAELSQYAHRLARGVQRRGPKPGVAELDRIERRLDTAVRAIFRAGRTR